MLRECSKVGHDHLFAYLFQFIIIHSTQHNPSLEHR
jgi:hypothetical protein